MSFMSRYPFFSAMPLLFFTGIVTADSNLTGVMLSNGCVNCHGADGRGATVGNIPPLKARPKEFLETAMKAYKSGTRQGTVMNRVMMDIDDQHITLLADYFSSIK